MSRVWDSDLPSDEKLVALALADWADDAGGSIYPSQDYLAWKVGKTDRAVRDSLRRLRERGIIEAVSGQGGGRGITVLYRFVASKLPARATWQETRDANPEEGSGLPNPEVDDTKPGSLEQETRKPTSDDPSEIHQSDPLVRTEEEQGQASMFDGEHRERLTVLTDMIAEAFGNRKGRKADRERLSRLIRRGATSKQMKNAIVIAKSAPRDYDVGYAIGVLARFIEEGVDGDAEVQRLTDRWQRAPRPGYYPSANGAGGVAPERQGPGEGGGRGEYAGVF